MHTNSSPPTCQPGIHSLLPPPLGELVQCLESRFAVPIPVGTALVLQVLSSALGPAARLVDGSMPPMPAELNTVILAPAGSTVPLAVQALLAPLLALQDELWALAAEPPSLHLPGSPPDPAAERARECPLILLSSPAFEDLQPALAGSFDGIVFDSKLEMAAYRWLKEHGIPFERQVEIGIQPGFLHKGKKHRPILYRADFRLAKCSEQKGSKCSEQNDWLWVDMKGFETADFKLKRKLLLFRGYEITCVKPVSDLINLLQESKTRTNFR